MLYSVCIVDGNDIGHHWFSSSDSEYNALKCVLETFNDDSYGMPYGIQIDGIKKIDVFPQELNYRIEEGIIHE